MAFLEIGGVAVKTPSTFTVGIQDISAPDSGRDINGLMHKGKIGEKRTIALGWKYLRSSELRAIVNAFQASEYFQVTYYDPTSATQLTKTFYLGDRSAPMYNFMLDLYEGLTFNIIER